MLADTTRVQLLWALLGGELKVNDLAERVGKPAPSVSQHLAKLRMARLVRTRRDGTQVFYRLENDHVRQLVTDAVHNAEHAAGGVPAQMGAAWAARSQAACTSCAAASYTQPTVSLSSAGLRSGCQPGVRDGSAGSGTPGGAAR